MKVFGAVSEFSYLFSAVTASNLRSFLYPILLTPPHLVIARLSDTGTRDHQEM